MIVFHSLDYRFCGLQPLKDGEHGSELWMVGLLFLAVTEIRHKKVHQTSRLLKNSSREHDEPSSITVGPQTLDKCRNQEESPANSGSKFVTAYATVARSGTSSPCQLRH